MAECSTCIHDDVCKKWWYDKEDCDHFLSTDILKDVDIYKIANSIAETTKQVTLAHLRTYFDNEGD